MGDIFAFSPLWQRPPPPPFKQLDARSDKALSSRYLHSQTRPTGLWRFSSSPQGDMGHTRYALRENHTSVRDAHERENSC